MGLFSRKKNDAPTTLEGSTDLRSISGFDEGDRNVFALLTILFKNELEENGSPDALQTAQCIEGAQKHFNDGKLSEFELSVVSYYFRNVDPGIFDASSKRAYQSLIKKLDKLKKSL